MFFSIDQLEGSKFAIYLWSCVNIMDNDKADYNVRTCPVAGISYGGATLQLGLDILFLIFS